MIVLCLLEFSGDLREIPRTAVHLKIVTGTYKLQTSRHSFNQNQVDPLCLLCKGANETIAHFLLDCTTPEITRQHKLKNIKHILRNCGLDLNNSETLLRLLMNSSVVIDSRTVSEVIFHISRLCYALHIERYTCRRLSVVPGRKRNRKT